MEMMKIREAEVLAERINRDRVEDRVPSADDTVRLCELLDILFSEEFERRQTQGFLRGDS